MAALAGGEESSTSQLLALVALALLLLAAVLCVCFCCAGALYLAHFTGEHGNPLRSMPGKGDPCSA